MQLEWQPELEEPLKQLAEWTYSYAEYTAQYDASPDDNTEMGQIKTRVDRLWSGTLKQLLLAPSEEDFDRKLEEFIVERQNLGYDRVMEEQTRRMEENKQKLGIR